MQSKKRRSGAQRFLVILAFYLSVILTALLLGATYQIADWVAQVAVALSLFRLIYVFGWGASRSGWGWRA